MKNSWMGWKMPLYKWHTFWMVPYLICLFFVSFFVILFYIEREWLLVWNVAPILPLKSNLSWKFQRFSAINRSIEMIKIVEFSKIVKYCKISSKAQTANRLKWFIQSPPYHPRPDKTLLRLGNKFFLRRYREKYRHLLSKCLKNAVLGR